MKEIKCKCGLVLLLIVALSMNGCQTTPTIEKTEVIETSIDESASNSSDNQIAYKSCNSGNGCNIKIVSVEGSSEIDLTTPITAVSGLVFGKFSWSPDGSRIAFVTVKTEGGTGEVALNVINSDGTEYTQLFNFLSAIDSYGSLTSPINNFHWSPDGTQIAFGAPHLEGTTIYGDVYDIYVTNTNGSVTTSLANVQGNNNGSVSWSPNGQYLAFWSWNNNDQIGGFYVMKPDGSEIKRLPDNAPAQAAPVWSADSSQIIYPCGDTAAAPLGICLSDPQGSSSINLLGSGTADIQVAPYGGLLVWATWTPDGKQILFWGSDNNANQALFSIKPDGSELSRIEVDNAQGFSISPDGSQIVFCRNKLVFITSINGTDGVDIATTSGCSGVAWRP